jgi:hypothetical protein
MCGIMNIMSSKKARKEKAQEKNGSEKDRSEKFQNHTQE